MSEGAAKGFGEKPQPKKEERRKFQAIRGTRDLLPPETALWNRVEQTAHEVFATFGYGEIRPPIFEQTDLFARSIGEETDVVSKEMFSFIDHGVPDVIRLANTVVDWPDPLKDEEQFSAYVRTVTQFVKKFEDAIANGDLPKSPVNNGQLHELRHWVDTLSGVSLANEQSKRLGNQCVRGIYLAIRFAELGDYLTLRPEATASVCRAYIEHNMHELPQPVKLYYIGPMFRRERPQKGRYRQFYQIGAEVLEATRPDGAKNAAKELAKDAAVDAEVIEMLMTFFDRVGLQGTELSINSIGHAADNCRRAYVAELRAALNARKDLLGDDSKRRIETNPLRILDSKVDKEQALIWTLPRIADHLCEDCKMHYAALKRELDFRGVKYRENWRLVRGLDYYMRTTFEITAPGLGSQNAVCGGGRYDGLVELLGGSPTKGIGFAIGEDRVVLSLVHDKPLAQRRDIDLVLAWLSPETYTKAIELARNLRTEGVKVDLPTKLMRAGDAVRYADRIGAYFTLLLGEDELKSGQLTLKHMLRQEQMKITEAELLSHLKHQNELREGRGKK